MKTLTEGEVRRLETEELVRAMGVLDAHLSAFEERLRTGRCSDHEYRWGLCWARQLKAHSAMLESLAEDSERIRDWEVRGHIRGLRHQAAVREAHPLVTGDGGM